MKTPGVIDGVIVAALISIGAAVASLPGAQVQIFFTPYWRFAGSTTSRLSLFILKFKHLRMMARRFRLPRTEKMC